MGDFGKKNPKLVWEKNKCSRRKRREGGEKKATNKQKNKAQNFLQSTETKSKFDLVGRNRNKKKKHKQTNKKRCQTAECTFQRTFFYTANPKPSQSRTFPPIHKKHTSFSQVPISLSLYHLNRASWTPH